MQNHLDIGLDEVKRQKSYDILAHILANEYVLYLETLNFHWNITGDNFIGLHKLLEEHYEWLKGSIDNLAEKIRALGFEAPANYRKFHKNTSIPEVEENLSAHEMLGILVDAHCRQIRELRQAIGEVSGNTDYSTEDLLIKMIGEHEQKSWMLRSHLLKHPKD